MSYVEEWFGPASQKAVAYLAEQTAGVEGAVIEVGCWEGRSTVAIANAVAPAVVHAVDTWEGSPGEVSWDLAHERDVLAAFLANVRSETAGNVVTHQAGWREYFANRSGPIRFLHIDAEHTYSEVFGNIAVALPDLVSGGIICGDDVHHDPVRTAVTDCLPDAEVLATLWWWQKP